jgi:hypothetical protein
MIPGSVQKPLIAWIEARAAALAKERVPDQIINNVVRVDFSAWLPPDTAPRDGSVFIARIGYDWDDDDMFNAGLVRWSHAIKGRPGHWRQSHDGYNGIRLRHSQIITGWLPLPPISDMDGDKPGATVSVTP